LEEEKDSEETLPNFQIHLSQPFSLSSSLRRIKEKQLEDKEEEEPRIRIKERWPVSTLIVSWFILKIIKNTFPVPMHELYMFYSIYA
jgi:hypothetical protein